MENILSQQYPGYVISTKGPYDEHSNIIDCGNNTYSVLLDKLKTVTLYILKDTDKDFKEQYQVTIPEGLTDEEEKSAVFSNKRINFPPGYSESVRDVVKNADGTFTLMLKKA